jgi:hypothetical protein
MLQIRPMGPQIGVEVTGVDVRRLDQAAWSRSTKPGSTAT